MQREDEPIYICTTDLLIPTAAEGTEYYANISISEQSRLREYLDKIIIFVLFRDNFPRGRDHEQLRAIGDRAVLFVDRNPEYSKNINTLIQLLNGQARTDLINLLTHTYPNRKFVLINYDFLEDLREYVNAVDNVEFYSKDLSTHINNPISLDH